MAETRLKNKKYEQSRGSLFVLKRRKKERVPLKAPPAIQRKDIERHDRLLELVSRARDRSRHALELDPASGCFPDTFDADAIDRHEELVLPDLHGSQAVGGHRKCLIVGRHDAVKEILREGKYGSEVKRDSVGTLRRINQFRPEAENIWSRQCGWRTHGGRSGARPLVIFIPPGFIAVTRG